MNYKYMPMHKPLIAALIPLLLLAATAAATPDAYALHQINATHWDFESTQYDLTEGNNTYQAFANTNSSECRTLTYGGDIPPTPTNLQHTTGNFWVNHTWSIGAGNIIDSYNVSVNSVWHNGTANPYYNDTYTAHAWQNIMVYAFSDSGSLSTSSTSQNTQIPNNAITITNVSDWSGTVGETVTVDCDATDADSDTATFSCNRTDLFTNFNTTTGTGTWAPQSNGTTSVDFGVSDGHGSTDSYTMTITSTQFSVKLTARAAGAEGNSIVTTETCENASFTASTLTGGRSSDITGDWAASDAPTGSGLWGDVGGMIGIALFIGVVALVIGYLRRET